MALLHHYTVSTSLTLSRDRAFQRFWQTTIVELGINDRFLIHGILSVSALHLAQVLPGDNHTYFADAARHHDIALTTYQRALQEMEPKRFNAMFATSFILFIYVFAFTAGDPLGAKPTHSDAGKLFFSFGWVRMVRGIPAIRRCSMPLLVPGPFKDLFGETFYQITNPQPDPPCPHDDSIEQLRCIWQNNDTISQERADLYSGALDGLVRVYRRAFQRQKTNIGRYRPSNGALELVEICIWLTDLSDGFIRLLEEHDPPALLLMCHYAKLMDSESLCFWWTQRNSQTCLSGVRQILDQEWHKWLDIE
jgi:hypothetical protein